MSDLLDLGLRQASQAIRAGDIDPVELTAAHLAAIESSSDLNAWTAVDSDGALATARTAAASIRAGDWIGPLHGIPVGIKDVLDTAGLRTSYGSPRFRDHAPTSDAAVVGAVRGAGGVILGKQATHEFAWGGRTDSPWFGVTRNPHDHTRVAGGSSGGGAASIVARAGLLAVGTDTAGSVRIPAALCGCVGFKPTRGWMPLAGAWPLAPSLDHIGLMARSVGDVITAGQTLGLGTPAEVSSLRIAVLSQRSRVVLDDAVRAAVDATVTRLRTVGVRVVEVDDPHVDDRVPAILTWIRAEAEQIHRSAFAKNPELYGPDLAELLDMGPVSAADLVAARRVADRSARWLRSVLRRVDVLVGATEPTVAPRIGEMTHELAGRTYPVEFLLTRLTSLANVAGLPALSLPVPGDGLPSGLQVVGSTDATVLGAACMIEREICASAQ